MNNPAYSVISVNNNVYVNSSGYYIFDVMFSWKGKRRTGQYDPMHPALVMTDGDRISIVNKYPNYLRSEIARAAFSLLQSGTVRFYEYNQDGDRRYENLRYHSDERLKECKIDVWLDVTEGRG